MAHNIGFDDPVLSAEFIRTGIKPNLQVRPQRICTMQASTDYCELPGRYGYKWPTLQELHLHLFGEEFDGAHDALVDVEVCSRCFFELVKLKVIRL